MRDKQNNNTRIIDKLADIGTPKFRNESFDVT